MNLAPIDSKPFGFILLDKPVGASSHDMVARVRRHLPRGTKVGHGGTLDPFAQGILVIGMGKATRFFDRIHGFAKTYTAVVRLGTLTDSLDNTGTVINSQPVPVIDQLDLDRVAAEFLGEQQQKPPAFSAKKVEGVRAYQLARKGQTVQLPAQSIRIDALQLRPMDAEHIALSVTCSTGTYVRSLGRDIAHALGTVGHLVELVRESIGPFHRLDALSADQIDGEQLRNKCIAVDRVFPELGLVALSSEDYEHLLHGRPIHRPDLPAEFLASFACDSQTIHVFFCKAEGDCGRVVFRCF